MSKPGIYLAVGLVLLGLWAIGASRRLARLRTAVEQAFVPLDAVLNQQLAWVEEFGRRGHGATPVPRSDAGVARWRRVQAAGRQLDLVLSSLRRQPTDAGSMGSFIYARRVLQQALAQSRAGTSVAGEGVAPAEWVQLAQQELPVSAVFNAAVMRYNRALHQFPASVLAWVFRLRPARTFIPVVLPEDREDFADAT